MYRPDKQGYIVTIVNICDTVMRLGTIIRRLHLMIAIMKQHLQLIQRFEIQHIIANESDGLVIAVKAIVTEHLPRPYLACSTRLLDNILHQIRI